MEGPGPENDPGLFVGKRNLSREFRRVANMPKVR